MAASAKFASSFPRHPKVIGLSAPAGWLFVCGVCYSVEYMTDGFIPASALVGLPGGKSRAVRELVHAKLWTPSEGGYLIHDFLHYQYSREERQRYLDGLHETRSVSGKRGAEVRWKGRGRAALARPPDPAIAPDTPQPDPAATPPTPTTPHSKPDGKPIANGMANPMANASQTMAIGTGTGKSEIREEINTACAQARDADAIAIEKSTAVFRDAHRSSTLDPVAPRFAAALRVLTGGNDPRGGSHS